MERTGSQRRMPGGIMPCKDGYIVVLTVEEHQWKALLELLGNPEWSRGDLCKDFEARLKNALEINALIREWMMEHTKEEIFRKGQALSCPVSPLYSAKDLANSEQLAARGFFVDMDHAEAGRLKFPSAPYQFSQTPWRLERPAPLLGQDNEEIYSRRLGYTREELAELKETGVV